MPYLWITILLLIASMAYAARSGAPWVPTWRRDIGRVRRLLDLKPGETVYELGCGDGRVAMALAKDGVRAVGIELSILQYAAANVRRVLARAWGTRFVFGNLFARDLSAADAVYLFLMPDAYKKIRLKLEAELRPGCRVVSFVWPIPEWVPTAVDECAGAPRAFLYVR